MDELVKWSIILFKELSVVSVYKKPLSGNHMSFRIQRHVHVHIIIREGIRIRIRFLTSSDFSWCPLWQFFVCCFLCEQSRKDVEGSLFVVKRYGKIQWH